MHTPTKTILWTSLGSILLLSGCGGGGGSPAVRNDPPPAASPPPELCSPPLQGDCIAEVAAGQPSLTGGRESDHGLVKRGAGNLELRNQPGPTEGRVADYRFTGGTTIEGGGIIVDSSAHLWSNVLVKQDGALILLGAMTGNVTNHGVTHVSTRVDGRIDNHGALLLWGTVVGNLFNGGLLTPGAYGWDDIYVPARIIGNFTQSATGTLDAVIGAASGGFITVTGRADIDGTVRLVRYNDSWGPYPLPTAPLSLRVLHADGGVFGTFSGWTSPGLFVTGNLRYGPNDVFFDANRLSLAEVMAAGAKADPLTLGTAARIDDALTHADRLASTDPGSLGRAQRSLLSSAGAILRISDVEQATRTLDSLSGHAHGRAMTALHAQATGGAAAMDARLDRLPSGMVGGPWYTSMSGADAPLAFDGIASGYDVWLSPRVLVGTGMTSAHSAARFDRMGGVARTTSQMASLHGHYRGHRWQLAGMAGAGRAELQLNRPLDLGDGAVHRASSHRGVGQMFAHVQAAHPVVLGEGRLTPYIALDYSAQRSDGFGESGATGLELVARPAHLRQASASTGVRYSHAWGPPGKGLRLDVHGRYMRGLWEAGRGPMASFAGTPDATFSMAQPRQGRDASWAGMGLSGHFDRGWAWSAQIEHQFQGAHDLQGTHWTIGLGRAF